MSLIRPKRHAQNAKTILGRNSFLSAQIHGGQVHGAQAWLGHSSKAPRIDLSVFIKGSNLMAKRLNDRLNCFFGVSKKHHRVWTEE